MATTGTGASSAITTIATFHRGKDGANLRPRAYIFCNRGVGTSR